jgi:hypothetical protein
MDALVQNTFGIEVKSRLDMVKHNSAGGGQCLQSEIRGHHEQSVKIVGHLPAGNKASPKEHAAELPSRFREEQEAPQLLPHPLAAC